MMSFVDKVVKSRDHLIRLVVGKNRGKPAWWYLRVENDLFEKYKIAVKSNSINLIDYGTILYSGWGTEPPEDIKQKIQEQFS